jgi:hypothetical protein
MPTLTLAEALAQFNLLHQCSERKQSLVKAHLLRAEALRDPFIPEGGVAALLAGELHSLQRLRERHVLLRRLIQQTYERVPLTIGDETRTLADWLVWKREVAPRRKFFLQRLLKRIEGARTKASVPVVVNLHEQELANEAEKLEQTLGQLQGLLQLKNATLTIEVPPDDWTTGLEDRLAQMARANEKASRPAALATYPVEAFVSLVWQSPELRQLARDPKRKIDAIKLYREKTGVGLAEAKRAVEAFAEGRIL